MSEPPPETTPGSTTETTTETTAGTTAGTTAETTAETTAADWVERVLEVVERVPRGRVTSYGAIGDAVGRGPRWVGNVLARHGGPVPWWRVVRADGSLPPSHQATARPHYLQEGTPLRPTGAVDIVRAFWLPGEDTGRGDPQEDERDD